MDGEAIRIFNKVKTKIKLNISDVTWLVMLPIAVFAFLVIIMPIGIVYEWLFWVNEYDCL